MTAIQLHGFGPRYDLPISLSLYLFAAAGVVVLSFVLVAAFAGERGGPRAIAYPRLRLAFLEPLLDSPWPRRLGGGLGISTFAIIVLAGIAGPREPSRNVAEYLVFVYFWAGLVVASGLLGDLWTLLNPWAAADRLVERASVRGSPRSTRALPPAIGIWPAVVLYFLFACLELTSGVASRPAVIGWLALAYGLVMLAGCRVFGRERWLASADAFSVFFRIVSAFGPSEIERRRQGGPRFYLRPPGAGLLRGATPGWERVVFVILMLSTLAFDGLLATPAFRTYSLAAYPSLAALGPFAQPLAKTAALMALTVLFFAAFTLVMLTVLWLGGGAARERRGHPPSALGTMTAFALTLVPIALAYSAAHNYTYLVIQSQVLWPLLADPLGRGWHLLPSGGLQPSFVPANAALVWYLQVVLIVVGHVIAVYLAHLRAGERFKTASAVLVSQYPMLLLMVAYTMTSLWILAQPITRES